MPQIRVAVFDKYHTILSAGLRTVLGEVSDVACLTSFDEDSFVESLRRETTQLALFVVKDPADLRCPLVERIRGRYPAVRMLVTAPRATREIVVEAIRCGAKGLIAGDAQVQELREAIYTVSNGHEYFSNSITGLLVGEYVETIRGKGTPTPGLELLSKREQEILTLWGDGRTNAEIADALFISVRTVESHKNHIMQKLKMRTTVDLLKFAIRSNLASL